MATFGNTGTSTEVTYGYNDYSLGGMFALNAPGLVSKLTGLLDNLQTGHAACHVKGLIYADASTQPAALAGASLEVALADSLAKGSVDMSFSAPVSLSAGSYWLAYHFDAAAAGVGIYRDATGGTGYSHADTYSDGPLDPCGAHTDSARYFCLYATYTAGGIGKLAWWLSAAKWNSPWEPRPSGLLLPKRALATI